MSCPKPILNAGASPRTARHDDSSPKRGSATPNGERATKRLSATKTLRRTHTQLDFSFVDNSTSSELCSFNMAPSFCDVPFYPQERTLTNRPLGGVKKTYAINTAGGLL